MKFTNVYRVKMTLIQNWLTVLFTFQQRIVIRTQRDVKPARKYGHDASRRAGLILIHRFPLSLMATTCKHDVINKTGST